MTADLSALTRLQLNRVDGGTGRSRGKPSYSSMPGYAPETSVSPTPLHAQGQNIAFLAISVDQQRQAGGAVGIILPIALFLGGNAGLLQSAMRSVVSRPRRRDGEQ